MSAGVPLNSTVSVLYDTEPPSNGLYAENAVPTTVAEPVDGNTTTEFSIVPVAIVIVGLLAVSAGAMVIVPIA